MKMQAYIDEIKNELTGGVLELEIEDKVIQKIVNSALRETQRYINTTKLITIPYQKCINLKKYNPNSVSRIYRATALGNATNENGYSGVTDPITIGLWQMTSNFGNMYNFNDYASRYGSWSTIQQIGNTLSTDLDFFFEQDTKNLYINTTLDVGSNITIEYIPRYDNVEDITSDYWIDIILRLSKALSKITLGRIRTRYTQSNALWTQDGEALLNEGNAELAALKEYLQTNTPLIYPLD